MAISIQADEDAAAQQLGEYRNGPGARATQSGARGCVKLGSDNAGDGRFVDAYLAYCCGQMTCW